MHKESLTELLKLLGSSEEEAALEYRKLHQRLSRFFEWNSVDDPMALADQAMDRLGKRAVEQADGLRVIKASAFAFGVARLLLHEENRRKKKSMEAIQHWEMRRPDSASEKEVMDEALERCLARMQSDRRELLERYYTDAGRQKARSHQRLADELGVTINALRNRALRARQELEACMRARLGEKTP